MGNAFAGYSETRRVVKLANDSQLIVEENSQQFNIDVVATRKTVIVGCTAITMEAWEEIVRRVRAMGVDA